MDYKKGKKELGIYYANMLVSIAEEISAKNTGKGKTGIQGIFSALQKRGTVRRNDISGHTLGLQIVTVYTMGRGRTLGSRYGKRSVLLSCDTSNMQQKEYFQNPEDRRRTRKTAGSNFKTANRFRQRSVYESILAGTCNYEERETAGTYRIFIGMAVGSMWERTGNGKNTVLGIFILSSICIKMKRKGEKEYEKCTRMDERKCICKTFF